VDGEIYGVSVAAGVAGEAPARLGPTSGRDRQPSSRDGCELSSGSAGARSGEVERGVVAGGEQRGRIAASYADIS